MEHVSSNHQARWPLSLDGVEVKPVTRQTTGRKIMSMKIMYTTSEANEKLKQGAAIAVDVRAAEDYAKGHIPGAVSLPEMFTTLSMTSAEGLQELQDIFVPLFRKAGIRKDQMVLVYEDNLASRYGGSCRGYFQLSMLGHKNVGVIAGGLGQWKKDGLPVSTEVPAVTPSDFEAEIQMHMLATKDDVLASLENPAIKLLDNRDEDEWLGHSSSPYGRDFAPRKGRIPGACWIEWYKFMKPSEDIQHFKSPEQVRAICAQAGLYAKDEIIIYCFKGSRASNTYIALKEAGFEDVRNYYGSWNEWSRDPDLPIHEGVLAE
jgi:thiosulfate/3-mercaptopyruvate sulfurtransferase